MIRLAGAAFTTAADGDQCLPAHRASVAHRLGVPAEWAEVEQVHGAGVVVVDGPGAAGEADALVTTVPGLVLAVRSADCMALVLHGGGGVGIAHAGWRGVAAGVVGATVAAMRARGVPPLRAVIGPHIGPCCFEVGDEVADAFPAALARTAWGSRSVDLASAVAPQLAGVEVRRTGGCTRCGAGWFSHRADATPQRLAALAWVA